MRIEALKRSLGIKLTIWLSLGLIIILFAITAMNIIFQNKALTEGGKAAAEELSETIITAMRYPMVSGDQDIIQYQFDQYKERIKGIEVIHLLDHKGVIRRSTDKTLLGKKSLIENLEESLKEGKKFVGFEFRKRTRGWIFAELRPIFNEPKCYACHGKDLKVLGAVRLALDRKPILAIIDIMRNYNLLFSLVGLAFMTALVFFLLRIMLVKPVNLLIEGTVPLAGGDFSHKINISTKDEIGTLANSFNLMSESLKQNIEELHQAYNELKSTQSQLVQAAKMEVVGTLAGGVAHEVKNPLAIILMGIEYISLEISPQEKRLHSVLEDMKSAVLRADYIVKELLDFSLASQLEIAPQDINLIIGNALILTKHECDKYHVQVIKELKEEIFFVDIDKNKIEQVFVNLFLNAIQSMPYGGTITVRTYTKELTEPDEEMGPRERDALKLEKAAVIVEIEDTGTGIPEDIIDKVFDPFFTTRRDKGGTGLGLSVVRSIIDLHKGGIRIENKKEGRGAKVTLMFKEQKL